MRRLAAAAGVLLLASACASPPADTATPPPVAPPAVVAPPAQTRIPAPSKDACGAAELQTLIGRPRTEIPAPLYPDRTRVACTTCPVTEDYRPERLNIFFDAESGLVRQIRCG